MTVNENEKNWEKIWWKQQTINESALEMPENRMWCETKKKIWQNVLIKTGGKQKIDKNIYFHIEYK